jgi:hypothetical protein
MNLKDQIRSGFSPDPISGFALATPTLERFTNLESFQTAVIEQRESTHRLNADWLTGVDLDGKLDGTGGHALHLSKAAFGDLCHFCKIPVSFAKQLSRENENLTLDLFSDRIRTTFHTNEDKVLVIDSRTGRIEGITGRESYTPLANAEVLDYVLSSNTELEMSNAWLEGPKARMTFIDGKRSFEPSVGDVVHIGTSIQTSTNGDSAVHICDYNERLVCTNGMTAKDRIHSERIIHRGDVAFNVQKAILNSKNRSSQMVPMMKAAVEQYLDVSDIQRIRTFIGDPKNNGNGSLEERAVGYALAESQRGGRDEGAVTLWDFVNGVTEAAHDTRTIHRRGELENLGYRVLSQFVEPALVS